MRVTFLGTGSAMPTGERMQTGLLLEGADPLLVDCGSGVVHRLAETDVGYEGVDTVLLTHHHVDHVSDLLPLLKARWLAGEETLTVVGPDGTRDLLDGLLAVHDYLQDRVDLTVREIDVGSFEVAGYDVEAVETVHSMRCLAYRFEADDQSFVFSGDSEATDAIADLAEGADALAHDCSFPDEIDVSNHPNPSKLASVLADTDVDDLYLTHLYPHTRGKHREMLETLTAEIAAEPHVAEDGLTVDLGARL